MKREDSIKFLTTIINTPPIEEDFGIYECIWCHNTIDMSDYIDNDGYGRFNISYLNHESDCPITKAKELLDKLKNKKSLDK